MKTKPKATKPTTGRRGRKPGDGVLKEIDPHDRVGTARKLFCGRTADDPIANMVRWGWMLEMRLAEFAEQGKHPPAEDAEYAANLLRRHVQHCEKLLREHNEKFAREAVTALAAGKADWFRQVAKAIETVEETKGQRLYPLHEALFFLAGQHGVNKTLPLTIAQVCNLLEKQGLRPFGMSDESWQRRVRTACKDLSLKLAMSKARIGTSKKRLTPATLGLPANYGTRTFWKRGNLPYLLYEARSAYRELIKRAHPDKGGDAGTFHETHQSLKTLWRNVQNAFKRHGYKLT